MRREYVILSACLILLAGCQSTGFFEAKAIPATIQVITEPPGAHIIVNGDYIGQSPCEIQTQMDAKGKFWSDCKIEALPSEAGQTGQFRRFEGRDDYLKDWGDTVPKRVFFNMWLGYRTPEIDVNVQP